MKLNPGRCCSVVRVLASAQVQFWSRVQVADLIPGPGWVCVGGSWIDVSLSLMLPALFFPPTLSKSKAKNILQ